MRGFVAVGLASASDRDFLELPTPALFLFNTFTLVMWTLGSSAEQTLMLLAA